MAAGEVTPARTAQGPADPLASLRRILDVIPTAAPNTPLVDLLNLVANTLTDTVNCGLVAVRVVADAGAPPLFVTAGTSRRHRRTAARLLDVAVQGRDAAHSNGVIFAVPVIRGDAVLGGLCIADPLAADRFTAHDELLTRALAAGTGAYVERVRAHESSERRQRWLAEAADITRDLLSGRHNDPLQLIADRVRELADADEVLVAHAGPRARTMVVDVGSGERAKPLRGKTLPASGTLSRKVLDTGEAMLIDRLADSEVPAELRELLDTDSSIIVPLGGDGPERSLLGLGRRPGRTLFTSHDVELASLFADQVALALELAESRAHAERLALLEDRDRIARDLHDHVIQRLFAIGLSIQSITADVSGDAGDQLAASVQDIDATISQIRSTIHRLGGPLTSRELLRVQAEELINQMELALGFRAHLELHGPVDFGPDDRVIDDCVAVLREGLANIARHAGATSATVMIDVADSSLVLEIRDDGRGLGGARRRSGLANLRARAERHGGELTVTSDRGTRLRWRIPAGGGGSSVGG